MLKKILLLAGLLAAISFVGCGQSEMAKYGDLERQIVFELQRFDTADRNFVASTNANALVENAYHLDKMAEAFREIERLEQAAISRGAGPVTSLKDRLVKRYRRHAAQFQADAQYVNAMHQFEIAKIWADL